LVLSLIILTGFGPYSNYKNNISSKIVQALDITEFNLKIKKQILSVSWKSSVKQYKEIIKNLSSKPDNVILLGIHSSKHYYLENFAWNFAFGKDIDNQIKFGVIRYKMNLCLKTKLDLKKIYDALKDRINLKLSNFPGFYLCNYIHYWALSLSYNLYPVLFIHIPHKECVRRGTETISKIINMISLLDSQSV